MDTLQDAAVQYEMDLDDEKWLTKFNEGKSLCTEEEGK